MRISLSLAALCALSTAAAAAPPSLNVTRYQLDNGLEVVLQPDPSVTTVVVHVWYHVGSKDEVLGKTGFAHLFEHLMFEGSKHVGEGQFDLWLEAAGGWNNGTTNNDRTNYFEQVPSNFLELALWLEADRMAGLWSAMNERVLINQRDVVKNELRQSYQNRPYGMAELAIQQTLWPKGHGNYNLTIGTMEDLDAASLADVEAFWRTHYRPSNATLVITGGIDLAATRTLVERYFGWMPGSKGSGRGLRPMVAPRSEPARLDLTDKVSAAKVVMSWRSDVPYTPAAADLEMAAYLLAGDKTSRLYRRLVMKERLASEVWVDHTSYLLGGELHLHAIARQGVSPDALAMAIADEVKKLGTTPPGDGELERARRVFAAGLLGGLEGLSGRAERMATWAAYTGKPDFLAAELALSEAVTPGSLSASVARWLDDKAAVTTVIRPEGAKP